MMEWGTLMKKCYLAVAVLVIVGIIIGSTCRQSSKEFEIVNSYKVGADNFQNVTLQVIVYVRNYDEEKMLNRIRDFYLENGGSVDQLTIKLYDSSRNFEKSICRIEKTFKKD